jgi:hypothetical protein
MEGLRQDKFTEVSVVQTGPQLVVRVRVKWVQVEAERAREEQRVLGNDRDPGPQFR